MVSWTQLRNEDVGGTDVRETQSEVCRSPSAICLRKKRSVCVIEESSMRCSNEDGQARYHVKNVVMNVSVGFKRKRLTWRKRLYRIALEFVWYVVGTISAVELDPRFLRETRQTEIDFVNGSVLETSELMGAE